MYAYVYMYGLGLSDIEIIQCNYCSKRHCDYVALEHFAA